MAESGGQDFSELDDIDLDQVLLIQSWMRGVLVRKWMRQVQECYQLAVTDIENDNSVWVDWRTEGLCKPKVTRRKRTDNSQHWSRSKSTTNPRGGIQTVQLNQHKEKSSDLISKTTSKSVASEKQVQKALEEHSRQPAESIPTTELSQEEVGFNSVETQTSLIEIKPSETPDVEETGNVLERIDTTWLERTKASKYIERENFTGEEDLHLDLESESGSVKSKQSEISEHFSQRHSERSPSETEVQEIELNNSFSDRSNGSEGSSTSLKERFRRSRSESLKHIENEKSARSDKSEEGQRSYRSVRSDRPEEGQRSSRSVRSDRYEEGQRSYRSDRSSRRVESQKDKPVKLDSLRDSHGFMVDREYGQRSLHSDRSERNQRSERSERSDRSAKANRDKYIDLEVDYNGQSSQRSNKSEDRKSDRSNRSRKSRGDRKHISDDEEGQRSQRSDQSDDVKSQKSDRSQRSRKSNRSSGRHTPEQTLEREPVNVKPRHSARSPVPTNHHAERNIVKGENSSTDRDPRAAQDSTSLTNVTSVWGSFNSVLESHEFKTPQSLPHDPEKLREVRKNVAMELLWVQQAIQSRKNYLRLKGQI